MAGALPRRISGFVQWLVRTPWPVFLLSQLQADIIGALLVLGFLRYGLPPEDRIEIVKGRLVVRILRVPPRMASEQPRANLGDG